MRRRRLPPSRVRYAATHPTIGIHVTLEERELLRSLSANSGLSVTQLAKQALGILEADVEAVRKKSLLEGIRKGKALGHQEGYAEGRRDGFAEAKAQYGIPYPCARCGGPLLLAAGSASAREAVRMLRAAGWRHKECPPPAEQR
jgi:hypothetical protein